MFKISLATVTDLPDIQTILLNTSSDWSIQIITACFNNNYFNWIVSKDNKTAGFITVRNNYDHWEIMQIVIDKNYQRQGLATLLVEYMMKQAQKVHVEKIQLEVRRTNSLAISLYQKCGFQEVGIRKKYYSDGEDAILMDRYLIAVSQ